MHRLRSDVSAAGIILITATGKGKSHCVSYAMKKGKAGKKDKALLLTAIMMLISNTEE